MLRRQKAKEKGMKSALNRQKRTLHRIDEINLFRLMSRIIVSLGHNAAFIAETHGKSGWVTFKSRITRPRMIWTKEISDLLICVHSKSTNEIRLSLLQAKFHRKRIAPYLKFKGDYLQLELLRDKPLINAKNAFGFPSDFLRLGNIYESFRCYGVFHYDAASDIDMLYSCACMLKEAGASTSTSGLINFTAPCAGHFAVMSPNEVISTNSLDTFSSSLLAMSIGVPISTERGLQTYLKKLLKFIRSRIDGGEAINLIDAIDAVIGSDISAEGNPISGNPNILLISTGEEKL